MAKLESKVCPNILRIALASALAFGLNACARDSHRALVPIELEATPESKGQTSVQTLEKMKEILDDDETLKPFVEDLLALAEGDLLLEQSKPQEAEAHYLKALKLDKGAAGKMAFEAWANVQPKVDLANGHNPHFIAEKLLNATQNGAESPWLKKQALTTQDAVSSRLEKLIGVKTEAAPVPAATKPSLPDPKSYSPSDDLYFETRARAVCKKSLDTKWVTWVSSLTVAQRTYWNGLLLNCDGEPRRASGEFRQAIATLSTSPEDTARAVRSAELLIQTLKAIGDRVGATEAYATQAGILKRVDLPLDLLKWSSFEKQKRFVDASYWVARNRAMQGDYERARAAAQDGLDTAAALETLAGSSKEKAQVIELKVEGLHVISSRIQYEQQDFAGALASNQAALATPGITKEWRQRLLWSEGWYEYRRGDKARAVMAFDDFLKEDLEDSNRTKALYWRGRAQIELGEKDLAEKDFDELRRLAPLSFYAVVGVPAIDKDVDWREDFESAEADRLSKIDDFEWGAYRKAPETMRRFHRLEFAVASRYKALYAGLGTELFDSINSSPNLQKEIEPSLYATRLMHMAEQYVLSISLSSSLSQKHSELWFDYPEQLLIFFPQAYRDDVLRFASKTSLEPELVWGLSRQESSFRKGVESPVGAIGLMQLMPNTAQELARSQGLSTGGIADRLKQPELNLQLGTLYLQKLGARYEGKWPRAIAAYNAGEYVVDTWMLRRDAPDLITWSEGLSFGETSSYVKNVWRNWEVYRWLSNRR